MADFKAFSPTAWRAFTKKCAALFPFLKKQYNMTSAKWEALTPAERIALAGQNVVITDDEGTQTFDDIIPSDASSTNKLATQSALNTVDSKIGDLADLETTVKTDVVSAINEIVTKVQSRPVVTVKTRTSSNSETRLTPSDVTDAGFSLPIGSYLVTVYRGTSSSLTYFIGWIWSTDTFDDSYLTKLAGEGTSLLVSGSDLVYNGGDSGANIEVTWIFQPIGDAYCDN